jgi:hypothetical protein
MDRLFFCLRQRTISLSGRLDVAAVELADAIDVQPSFFRIVFIGM